MGNMVVGSMQWAKIEDISETEPLNEGDQQCISEVRKVLQRHGKLKKFGLTLIHSHFPIGEDEVLVEEVSKVDRTLTIKPMKASMVKNAVDTQWCLDNETVLLKCWVNANGEHYSE